jgi:hypothetical protein
VVIGAISLAVFVVLVVRSRIVGAAEHALLCAADAATVCPCLSLPRSGLANSPRGREMAEVRSLQPELMG